MTDERAKDVVEVCRSVAARWDVTVFETCALRDAAEELERLQKENSRLQDVAVESQRAAVRADAELSSERKAKHSAECHIYALNIDLNAKDAEIARLRTALKPFAALAPKARKVVDAGVTTSWASVRLKDLVYAAEVLKP